MSVLRWLATVLAVAATACSTTPDTQVTGPPRTTTYDVPQVVHDFTPEQTTTTTTVVIVPATTAPAVEATVTEVVPLSESEPVPQTGSCGGWEQQVAAVFPGEVGTACRVLMCESRGNPSAVSSTADHGLMQVNEPTWNKPGHHDPVADWIGRHWHSVYDPATNLEMARRIRAAYGWGMWACFR